MVVSSVRTGAAVSFVDAVWCTVDVKLNRMLTNLVPVLCFVRDATVSWAVLRFETAGRTM